MRVALLGAVAGDDRSRAQFKIKSKPYPNFKRIIPAWAGMMLGWGFIPLMTRRILSIKAGGVGNHLFELRDKR